MPDSRLLAPSPIAEDPRSDPRTDEWRLQAIDFDYAPWLPGGDVDRHATRLRVQPLFLSEAIRMRRMSQYGVDNFVDRNAIHYLVLS